MELQRAELNEDGQAVDKTDDPEGRYLFHQLEQVDLMTLEEGLTLLAAKYTASIDKHREECSKTMCMHYVPARRGQTCAEDLMFLHDQLARINKMLFLIQGEGL